MPGVGGDGAAVGMIGPNGDRLSFIYPETWWLLVTPGCAKRASVLLHRINAHLFFQFHVNETLSPSMLRKKWNSLRISEQSFTVLYMEILGRKGKSKSTWMFQERLSKLWQKDPRQCISCVTGMEWTFRMNLLWNKWIRALAVFSKDKNVEAHTWEHLSFEERNLALHFFPCECENNIQQDPCLFHNLETVLKSYGNHFPYKRRGIFFFK